MFGAPEAPLQRALVEALKATPLEGRPGSIEALYVAHFGDAVSPEIWHSGHYYTGSYKVGGQTLTAAMHALRART